jgi:ABC-2 type transport system ATP-binding protein
MINDPPIVFLDEPTTGVDAHSRRAIHDWLGQLRAEGRTVFLTTHYIHEAEQLADRVAIMARGKIVRKGTLEEIRAGLTVESRLRVTAARPLNADALSKLASVQSVNVQNGSASLSVLNPAQTISALVRYLDSQQNELTDIAVSQPTLEDLFLRVVGERLAGEDD